jgi:hypothetical protein
MRYDRYFLKTWHTPTIECAAISQPRLHASVALQPGKVHISKLLKSELVGTCQCEWPEFVDHLNQHPDHMGQRGVMSRI